MYFVSLCLSPRLVAGSPSRRTTLPVHPLTCFDPRGIVAHPESLEVFHPAPWMPKSRRGSQDTADHRATVASSQCASARPRPPPSAGQSGELGPGSDLCDRRLRLGGASPLAGPADSQRRSSLPPQVPVLCVILLFAVLCVLCHVSSALGVVQASVGRRPPPKTPLPAHFRGVMDAPPPSFPLPHRTPLPHNRHATLPTQLPNRHLHPTPVLCKNASMWSLPIPRPPPLPHAALPLLGVRPVPVLLPPSLAPPPTPGHRRPHTLRIVRRGRPAGRTDATAWRAGPRPLFHNIPAPEVPRLPCSPFPCPNPQAGPFLGTATVPHTLCPSPQ
eukprot:EG_transcript_11380